MSKKLLVAASFGTTFGETCERNIGAVERAIAAALPEYDVARAFTSGMVRRALAKRGVLTDDVPAALARAKEQGYETVKVLPTHLLYGVEYDKMCRQCAESAAYADVAVGKPLLAGTEDLLEVVRVLAGAYPRRENTCVVLMGHGTEHYVNPVYAALDYMFAAQGRPDVIVGTVEAYPGIVQVRGRAGGYKEAVLAPLMLVAGDHARNDMAGSGADSWQSVLEADGVAVRPVLRGLGELAGICGLYAKHAHELAGGGTADIE